MGGLSKEEEVKKEICRVIGSLYRRGLITALGGNVSARLPGAQEFWITPSGVFKGGLTPNDLVKLDLECNVVEGVLKPSIEAPFHAAIYRVRSDVNAVVHAHNPFVVGLNLAGVPIKPITVEGVIVLKRIDVIPFAFPGTDKLAKLVEEAISKGGKALILQNHGVVAVGVNLVEAEAIVEALEEVAIAQFVCYALGKEPPLIPKEEVEIYKF